MGVAIYLMGPLKAEVDGQNLTDRLREQGEAPIKALHVLAVLALRARGMQNSIERDELIRLLWSDKDQHGKRDLIRHYVCWLRAALEPYAACIGGKASSFLWLEERPVDLWVDLWEFDDACEKGDAAALQQAQEQFNRGKLFKDVPLTGRKNLQEAIDLRERDMNSKLEQLRSAPDNPDCSPTAQDTKQEMWPLAPIGMQAPSERPPRQLAARVWVIMTPRIRTAV